MSKHSVAITTLHSDLDMHTQYLSGSLLYLYIVIARATIPPMAIYHHKSHYSTYIHTNTVQQDTSSVLMHSYLYI